MIGKPEPVVTQEPEISVGIMEGGRKLTGRFNGPFRLDGGQAFTGSFSVEAAEDSVVFTADTGKRIERQKELCFRPGEGATFTLTSVTIGVNFHWERTQEQTFQGELLLDGIGGTLTIINRLHLEDYLASVISSEMSAEAPLALLKAHAVTSRSWLMAMLKRRGKPADREIDPQQVSKEADEVVRWYDREDHARFDVCADDHCQRYQGITKIISDQAAVAVQSTRGIFLVYDHAVCDARFHKCCGGRTESFENTWEATPVPYLSSIVDADIAHGPVDTEAAAGKWVLARPDAYCGTTDEALLQLILPDFDRETKDFFRWQIIYRREELETILREKSGIDFGLLQDLVPVNRGPSGRIFRLRIEGSKRTLIVGKELEIRRWLSRSHLYSSAFCVSVERDASGLPVRFTLNGAGWGHGVGLCQIGAAVMAARGYEAEDILRHYFNGAGLEKLYE